MLILVKKYALLALVCVGLSINQPAKEAPNRIQIALLLDISGSMNGLLSQVQSQFWQLLEFLEQAEKQQQKPIIELAVITVGDRNFITEEELRILAPFSSDFDCILSKMIELQCIGGNEYFGKGLMWAIDSLQWSPNPEDFRTIIMAGNETLEQGKTDFRGACSIAKDKNIIINTLYCGNEEDGYNLKWLEAAQLGGGIFKTIDHNDTVNISSPYDAVFNNFYKNFQNTIIPYSDSNNNVNNTCIGGSSFNVIQQNSALSREFIIQQLQNKRLHHDLITECEKDSTFLTHIERQYLPANYQQIELIQLHKIVQEKIFRREMLREGVMIYQQKVEEYLNIKYKNRNKHALSDAFQSILKPQLEKKGFLFSE